MFKINNLSFYFKKWDKIGQSKVKKIEGESKDKTKINEIVNKKIQQIKNINVCSLRR